MTRPFTTAPADTARAMHAAEMRGFDMQDAPDRIWATEDKANFGEDRFHSTTPMRGLTEYTRTDLCITEAECQRRIDAAVLALTEALKSSKETHVGIAQHILDGGHNTSGIFADSQRARLAIDKTIHARRQK